MVTWPWSSQTTKSPSPIQAQEIHFVWCQLTISGTRFIGSRHSTFLDPAPSSTQRRSNLPLPLDIGNAYILPFGTKINQIDPSPVSQVSDCTDLWSVK